VTVGHENTPPVADAGDDQWVDAGDLVTLDAGGSTDPDDGIASYFWEQTGGVSVALTDQGTATPTFTAPEVDQTGETLTFRLTVSDTGGMEATDTCNVEVAAVSQPRSSSGGGCFIGSVIGR
jgi:hypothetical protein